MISASFLLLTISTEIIKLLNIVYRRRMIKSMIDDFDQVLRSTDTEEARAIVKRCDRETTILLAIYAIVTIITMVGFAAAADKGMLPIRAWFPYDVTKHPNYEITYTYQILALSVDAFLNVSTDTLVSSLMAQVRCRFQLLGLSLRNLCQGIRINEVRYLLFITVIGLHVPLLGSRLSLWMESRPPSVVVGTADAAETNGLSCLPNHGEARDTPPGFRSSGHSQGSSPFVRGAALRYPGGSTEAARLLLLPDLHAVERVTTDHMRYSLPNERGTEI
ncbi:hypothetical protein evm_009491 [Chilo suppressalis]|nr:hypothetical protein evm_009491 [Chilo suppressalis]